MSNQLATKTVIITQVSQDLSFIYYLNFYNQRPLTYVSVGVVKKKQKAIKKWAAKKRRRLVKMEHKCSSVTD